MSDQIHYGCSDGQCDITGKASGQHTNGGCRCLWNYFGVRAPSARLALRKAFKQVRESASWRIDRRARAAYLKLSDEPHAPAEHDKAGAWNAFGLVDMVGNFDEVCADRPNMRGNFATEPRDMGRLSEYEACTVPNDSRVGFRAALNIPGL